MTTDQEAMDALAEAFDLAAQSAGGCGDGYCCVTGKAVGQHTNGGCRCSDDRRKAQRMMLAGRRLRDGLRSIVRKE